MTKLFKVFVISMLTVSVTNVIAGCEQTLVGPLRSNLARQNSSKSLIGYLQKALEEHGIGQEELVRLVVKLNENTLENSITEEQAMLDGQLQIHRKNIQRYIDKGYIDLTELLLWAEKNLKEENRVRKSREDTRDDTQELFRKIKFNPVRKGNIRISKREEGIVVSLENSIEVMASPVTQWQWTKIMGSNPSSFAIGEHAIDVYINNKLFKMRPDNPVESVTSFRQVLEFANELSKIHGFKPVYDLRKMRGETGIYAPDGDYYQTEGFRLPTEIERKYMLGIHIKNMLKINSVTDFHSVLDRNLELRGSTGMATHAVGEKSPLVIDGGRFYDLIGNVKELIWDLRNHNLNRSPSVGFRLVRTLKENE